MFVVAPCHRNSMVLVPRKDILPHMKRIKSPGMNDIFFGLRLGLVPPKSLEPIGVVLLELAFMLARAVDAGAGQHWTGMPKDTTYSSPRQLSNSESGHLVLTSS